MLNKSGGKNYRSRATLLIAILVMSYFVALTPFHLFGYLQVLKWFPVDSTFFDRFRLWGAFWTQEIAKDLARRLECNSI